MRFVSLTLFLAAALFAQAPPSGPDQQASPSAEPAAPPQAFQRKPIVVLTPEQRARNFEKLKQELESAKNGAVVTVVGIPTAVVTSGKTAMASAKSCSIPLLNAMPRNAQAIDKKMILPAPANSRAFAIRQITPPAPPCDERAWRDAPAPSTPNAKP
jgi:hypothetical protein